MNSDQMDRRNFLSGSFAVTTGAVMGIPSLEEKILMAHMAQTPSTAKPELKNPAMPTGQIGPVKISRLICGGNLITGWAHSRDLIYVSNLLKHYFTEEKIIETLQLCEAHGINTIIVHPDKKAVRILKKYRNECGGKIQWIAQVFPMNFPDISYRDRVIPKAADDGAVGIFVEGTAAEWSLEHGRLDLIEKAISQIKKKGLIAGVGGHSLRVPIACEAAEMEFDFYVKTLHRDDYWSATPKEYRQDMNVDSQSFNTNTDHNKDRDNIFCINPEEVIEFMAKVKKPWIAYKVLAAGAIHPRVGFDYAFQNGADFVLAGFFDFQVAENVKIAVDCAAKAKNRSRKWMA